MFEKVIILKGNMETISYFTVLLRYGFMIAFKLPT